MLVAVDDEQPSLFLIGTGDGRVTNEARLEGVPKAAQIVRYAPDNSLIAVSSLNSDLVSLIGPSFRQQTAIKVGSQPMGIFRSSLQSTTSTPTRAVNPLGFSRAHGGLGGDGGQRQAMLNRSAL